MNISLEQEIERFSQEAMSSHTVKLSMTEIINQGLGSNQLANSIIYFR